MEGILKKCNKMDGNPDKDEDFRQTGPSYAEVVSGGGSEDARGNKSEQFDRSISRDNPKFHSVPKARWRTTTKVTDYSPARQPMSSGLTVPRDETGHRSRSLVDLTKSFLHQGPEQPYIPGLSFKQSPPREISSRRNSRRRKKSSKKGEK